MLPNIGLTGATGTLGRHVARAFDAGGSPVNAFGGDIRNREEVAAWIGSQTFDVVVHSAAMVPVTSVAADPGGAIAVNVAGTANIASAIAGSATQLVYISTSHVYRPTTFDLTENSEIEPVSLYGLTKWQGEQWVRMLHPSPLILRVFSFFDAEQPSAYVVPKLRDRVRAASSGETLPLFGFHDVRDITSAEWIANVVVAMVRLKAAGTYNCGTGEGIAIADLARAVARSAERTDVTFEPAGDNATPTRLVADVALLARTLGGTPEFRLSDALDDLMAGAR